MTTATTIKVSTRVRDRIKAQAGAFRSMDEYLDQLMDAEERRQMVAALRRAVQQTSDDELRAWQDESDAWEQASLRDGAEQ
ncbi:MAG: hypothetical protein LBR32_01245 [Propionibacteriaceae bacterium]|jgi:hypothetical protein|nr:hypothetical protein [Propionibacteriaceae bacterium]